MRKLLIGALLLVSFVSCDNRKQERDYYIRMSAVYRALNSNSETSKIEYLDSIHKYEMLIIESYGKKTD